jgi:NADH-quinone oxidoreductase subunit C
MNQQELENKLEKIKNKLINIEKKSNLRIFLNCESENAHDVCKYLFRDLRLRFVIATGIDAEHCFEVLYHFSNDETGAVVTVKAFIRDRENPAIESITPFVTGAEWIEREIHDILGIDIKNHPNLKRLILADDWPQDVYPLRKNVKE